MVTTGVQKFYVSDSPFNVSDFNLANTSSAGYDPTDRERLYMHYNPAAGKITLDPIAGKYGNNRANTLGGNYDFDPNGDYLNSGMFWGQGGSQMPIQYKGQGLDQPTYPATGPGGGVFANNLRVGVPRMSATPNGYGGPIQCPYGFYTVGGNTCLPGVNLDPTRPENILGITTPAGLYQDIRGVIERVITPVKTQKGQLFQIVTQVKNIGNAPGKISTKITIPLLNIQQIESNSAFLEPGKSAVVYQSLQMPSQLPPGLPQLIPVTSELYVASLKSPNATPTLQDSNTANMPSPDTTLGMPPPVPAIPNIPNLPIPQGTPGGFNPAMPPSGPRPTTYPFPVPQPMPMPYFPQMPGALVEGINVFPNMASYPAGTMVTIVIAGYDPGQSINFGIYTKKSSSGIFIGSGAVSQKIGAGTVIVGPNGVTQPTRFSIPAVTGSGGGISIMGMINIGGSSKTKQLSIQSAGNSRGRNKRYEKTINVS